MNPSHAPSRAERVRATAALLQRIAHDHRPAVLASSLGAEDMVLLDLIAGASLPIHVFTIDTGRLPQATHDLVDRARARYGVAIEIHAPDARAIEGYVRAHGTNAFYDSVALRERCCAIRKVAPLGRALAGAGAWITGLRRAQGVTRADVALETYDEVHAMTKFNPLADWSDDDVWGYVDAHDVPVNALHREGYPSIGCAPCTRAVAPGDDPRSGRWWWERAEHRECGLHRHPVAVRVGVGSVRQARP